MTTGGHKAILREWITLGEYRQIMAVYMKVVPGTGAPATPTADALNEGQDLSISFVIVSLDESSEDVVKRLLALPNDDPQEILAAVEEASNPKNK